MSVEQVLTVLGCGAIYLAIVQTAMLITIWRLRDK